MSEHPKFTMYKGRPETHKVVVGETSAKVPLEDQIFPEEFEALKYLKSVCPTCVHYDDEFLLACLFARKMDIARTIELVERNWKWRIDNGFETLPPFEELDWDFAKGNVTIPGTRTKDGFGVVYALAATQDPSVLQIEKVLQWCAWYYTYAMFHLGMDVARNGILLIMDLDGYGWKHFDRKFNMRMMEVYQDNFPLRLKKSILINSPSIFKIIFGLMKPFMKKKMVDRFGPGTIDDLIERVDKDQLWTQYGGSYETSNPSWIEMVKQYGRQYEEKKKVKAAKGEKAKGEKKSKKSKKERPIKAAAEEGIAVEV